MKILITGSNGQLGQALQQALSHHDLIPVDVEEMDITDKTAVFQTFADAEPDVVIHCAAYTNVDGCAKNPALAYQVNGLGTQNIALASREIDAELVHISTNEVFSGDDPHGYYEWMPLSPRNEYGRSKAAAEHHVRHLVPNHYIVRLAWLFAPGGRNFIHAILRRARETGQLRVVSDEIGNPTYASDLAQAITQLIATQQFGTYHLTNSGSCSRWAFANEIVQLAGLENVSNAPILSSEFRRASSPPPFGVLHNLAAAALGITLRPWQAALASYMEDHL